MRTGTELLSGVTVPLVTPMDPGGQPSAAASLALLEAMHAAGVRRLMLLGSNGEGPLIPTAAFAPFVADVVAHWRSLSESGVVTVNVTAPGTLDAVGRATIAADAGADALVMSPPIYFHHRDVEIVDHYAVLAGSGLPVIAYNAPRYSNPITDAVLDGLLELEHVVGIKDSSGDLAFLTQLVARGRRRPGFAVSQGAETKLAAALDAGADGITPGIANIAPGLSLQLAGAHAAGQRDQAQRLQARITELTKIHTIRPGTPTVKEILAQRSLCPPHVAPPLRRCDEAERHALHEFITPHEDQLLRPVKGSAA